MYQNCNLVIFCGLEVYTLSLQYSVNRFQCLIRLSDPFLPLNNKPTCVAGNDISIN
jgi:hypothetical protein